MSGTFPVMWAIRFGEIKKEMIYDFCAKSLHKTVSEAEEYNLLSCKTHKICILLLNRMSFLPNLAPGVGTQHAFPCKFFGQFSKKTHASWANIRLCDSPPRVGFYCLSFIRLTTPGVFCPFSLSALIKVVSFWNGREPKWIISLSEIPVLIIQSEKSKEGGKDFGK